MVKYHWSELNNMFSDGIPIRIYTRIHHYTENEHIANCIFAFDTETTTFFKYPDGKWDIYHGERDVKNYGAGAISDKFKHKDVPKNAVDYTQLPKHTVVYLWTFTIWSIKDWTFYGRTNQEFKEFLENLHEILKRQEHKDVKMYIYVHNLGFDFTNSLCNILDFSDVFCRKAHKPIYARTADGLTEFRCSYMLTNSSLGNLTKDNVHYKKNTDYDDYLVARTPDTELDEETLDYACLDTASLAEALSIELKYYGYIWKIPLTSTGKLRTEVADKLHGTDAPKRDTHCIPTVDMYHIMQLAFQGGDTHANVVYVDDVLENIHSFDRQSSYPAVMLFKKYPSTPFTADSPENWQSVMNSDTQCSIGLYTFFDVKVRGYIPYFKMYKCVTLGGLTEGVTADNGRVWSAKKVTMWLTDVDMKVVLSHYSYSKIACMELYTAGMTYLTYAERDFILTLYENKTRLKGVSGREEDYKRSKNFINSEFGRNVTRPVDATVEFDNEHKDFKEPKQPTRDEIAKKFKKMSGKEQYTMFARGVFITAWARYELYRGIDICGDKHVYNDTDCCKFIYDEKIIRKFDELNEQIKQEAKDALPPDLYARVAPVDKKGIEHFIGTWDWETRDSPYVKFKTMGAKKYACQFENGEIELTVSGLSKDAGENLTDIEQFEEGTLFTSDISGRTVAVYQTEQPPLTYNGHTYTDKVSLSLLPTTYQLGMTSEYSNFVLQHSSLPTFGDD